MTEAKWATEAIKARKRFEERLAARQARTAADRLRDEEALDASFYVAWTESP